MPTKDMSSKIGKSSSPTAERVIRNSTNVQQPFTSVKAALGAQFSKKPVKVG